MYEILYTKQAMKDIEKLKINKNLYARYLEKEKEISINPKCPNVPQGDFSELKGNLKVIYHIRLNQKHRIFYTISDNEREIYIDKIEEIPDGKVKILQAFGHDLR